MTQVSVPFRHAPGGAVVFQKNKDAVPIRKVVVLRSLAQEIYMVLTSVLGALRAGVALPFAWGRSMEC